jgi:hypothetical protein
MREIVDSLMGRLTILNVLVLAITNPMRKPERAHILGIINVLETHRGISKISQPLKWMLESLSDEKSWYTAHD